MSLRISTAHKSATKCTVLTDTDTRRKCWKPPAAAPAQVSPEVHILPPLPAAGNGSSLPVTCSASRTVGAPQPQPVTLHELEDPYPTATESCPVALTL